MYSLPSLSSLLELWLTPEDQYLTTDENVEQCCANLFRSQLFIRNAEKVRYELISIANQVRIVSQFGNDDIDVCVLGGCGYREPLYCILGSVIGWTNRT